VTLPSSYLLTRDIVTSHLPLSPFLCYRSQKRCVWGRNALRTLQLYPAKALTRKSDLQKPRFFSAFSSLFHQNVRLCCTLSYWFPISPFAFCLASIHHSPVICLLYPVIPSPLFSDRCIAMFFHPYSFQHYASSPRGGVPPLFFHPTIFFSMTCSKNNTVKTPLLCHFITPKTSLLSPVREQTLCSSYPRLLNRNFRRDRSTGAIPLHFQYFANARGRRGNCPPWVNVSGIGYRSSFGRLDLSLQKDNNTRPEELSTYTRGMKFEASVRPAILP